MFGKICISKIFSEKNEKYFLKKYFFMSAENIFFAAAWVAALQPARKTLRLTFSGQKTTFQQVSRGMSWCTEVHVEESKAKTRCEPAYRGT